MAIKDIVTRGYGPSEVKFIPTRGYVGGAVVAEEPQLLGIGMKFFSGLFWGS